MLYTGRERERESMMCGKIAPYVALIILLGCYNAGVKAQRHQPAIFYPFGISENDAVLFMNDDQSTEPLSISIGFPYFDNVHGHLYVSINVASLEA